MQSQTELRSLLQKIDHRGYPAYKDTKGSYDFGSYVLSIDHVQGDPFASPSKVSVHVKGGAAKVSARTLSEEMQTYRRLRLSAAPFWKRA